MAAAAAADISLQLVAVQPTIGVTMFLGNWLCFHHKHENPCLQKGSFKGKHNQKAKSSEFSRSLYPGELNEESSLK